MMTLFTLALLPPRPTHPVTTEVELRRLIGTLKKFRTRLVRKLTAMMWATLEAATKLVISPDATGLWLWAPWLRCVQLQHGIMVATRPVEVCPRVLVTTSSLTRALPVGRYAGRTMNMLPLWISLLTTIRTLLPPNPLIKVPFSLKLRQLVTLPVNLGPVPFAKTPSPPLLLQSTASSFAQAATNTTPHTHSFRFSS